MKTHLALLRGVNVGGNKKLPMAELRAFVEALGFTHARTLLQSGNLVFQSNGKRDDTALETYLDAEAAQRLNLITAFLVRTADEWSQVIARNPFPDEAKTAPGHLITMFFRQSPTPEALDLLRAAAIGTERFHADGRQLYAIFPEGIGDSRMANTLLSARFSKQATGRNWNTVLKLGTLAGIAE